MKRFSSWVGAISMAAVCVTACSADAPSVTGTKNQAGISGGTGGSAGFSSSGGSSGVGTGIAGSSAGFCTGLQCEVHDCTGAATSISGVVYDPAGKNPLYNVVVYVPNEPVQPLTNGPSCEACSELYTGRPIATALTNAKGEFLIEKAPDGANIPLVVQVGKWRREFVLPSVARCAETKVPDRTLTLPKNRNEGHIPNIAISTGGADTLECLLRRIGIDESEYTPGTAGDARIHIYQGTALAGGIVIPGLGALISAPNTNPPAPLSSMSLWNTVDALMAYDIVLLSCEGGETANMNQQALHDYASAGGRVFASHFHYSWFNSGPYGSENLATWTPGGNNIGDINGSIVTTLPNGMPFPKGVALHDWLTNVNALQNGVLPIVQARHNADVSAANVPSQPWIVADPGSEAPGATQYFSFNTPTDAPMQTDSGFCGRVVFSDLHVGAASGDMPLTPVPQECVNVDLSPQEKALEFMLFDLSSCVMPDNLPPEPPEPE